MERTFNMTEEISLDAILEASELLSISLENAVGNRQLGILVHTFVVCDRIERIH